MKVNRTREPFRFSTPAVKRPANLEDVAFWPVTNLAQLIKTKQVTSVELTEMYLARLHKYNDEAELRGHVPRRRRARAGQAGRCRNRRRQISADRCTAFRWGAKDIIAVKGYKTTWGSGAYKDQMIDEEASVVEMLREAGAVLLAKLTSGELAQGDSWFGGQTKNPWNPDAGLQRIFRRARLGHRRAAASASPSAAKPAAPSSAPPPAAASPACAPPSAASAATA